MDKESQTPRTAAFDHSPDKVNTYVRSNQARMATPVVRRS